MEKKLIISLTGLLLLIILPTFIVLAIRVSNLDNGLSAENLTFTGNQNISRNLSIYRYGNVSNAILNLSQIYSTGLSNSSDDIASSSGSGVYRELCTKMQVSEKGRQIVTMRTGGGSDGIGNITIRNNSDAFIETSQINCFGNIIDCVINTTKIYNADIYEFCATSDSNNILSMRRQSIYPGINISSSSTNYPFVSVVALRDLINSSLYLNSTLIWNFTEIFNQTNNKTLDFSSALNTAINNGLCNGGTLTNTINCTIPFIFHSDTAGILEYSDIQINWNESIKPNLTINTPTGSIPTTLVPISINATDDNLQYCYFNITRGQSLEVGNTQITNCNSTTYTVSSSFSTYNIFVYINDSSGNYNTTNSTFTVGGAVGGSSGGGGGGGGFIQDVLNQLKIVQKPSQCEALFMPLSDAYQKWNINKNYDNFIVMWYAFWNFVLCKDSASIIPI